LKDALSYIYFVNNNGYDGLNFLKDYPQFAKDYQIALPVYSTNSTLFKIIYDKFLRDPQITADRNSLFLKALKLYKELNLADKNLFSPTINALNNITIANEQLNLPKLDKNTLWLLVNCTQKPEGKYLVDFSPLIFKSVNSSDVILKPNPARETWLLTKHMEDIIKDVHVVNYINLTQHPEMFLGLNGKIIANAYSIFDNPYGIKYYEKNLTTSDRRVLELLKLQWELYSQFSPQRNGTKLLYNRDFPWYNSTELTKLYPDKNELRIALLKLFYLPSVTHDINAYYNFKEVTSRLLRKEKKISKNIAHDLHELMEHGWTMGRSLGYKYKAHSIQDVINFIRELENKHKIDGNTANELIDLVKKTPLYFIRIGIEGAKIDLLQAYNEYKKIVSLYPNGTIGRWSQDPRDFYYGWLGDRAGHGLENTVAQFLGIDPSSMKFPMTLLEWLRLVKNNNGIDGYLTKHWKYWDLVKFIVGYERWNPKVGELEGIIYVIPSVLRMAGYPVSHIGIDPTPLGASGSEWAISLPQYVINEMKENFANEKILIGPGNTFGLYSCGSGLLKERLVNLFRYYAWFNIDQLKICLEEPKECSCDFSQEEIEIIKKGFETNWEGYKVANGILEVMDWLGDKKAYLMKRD